MNTPSPVSAPDALQELHDELYRAQRTERVEVLMDSIGKARLLLARYRDSLAKQAAPSVASGVVAQWVAAYGAYLAAVDDYNTRLANIRAREAQFPREFGNDNPHAEFRAVEDTKQAALALLQPLYAALAAPGAAIAAREQDIPDVMVAASAQEEWIPVTPEQHSEAFAAGDLMALAEEAGGARMAENVVQVTRSDIERIIDFAKGRQEAAAASDVPLGAIENGRMYVERIEQEGFECEAGRIDMCSDWQELGRCFEHLAGWALSQRAAAAAQAFQARVQPWLLECFGEAIAGDREERNHRFLEEALELVQACGCTASEAHQLVDYTFGRPVGEKGQEVGGVMVTLAALCLAQDLDMHAEGETELARISVPELVARIRAKQAAKPKHSPLPAALTPRKEEPAPSAETPSAKQQKLLTLADRIDHEELWRWAGMDHHKMTPEQRDRMNAGVALRRYARLWAPGHWVVFPPIGPVSFSATTLDKAVEMARRSPPPAAPGPDDTPLETGEADAR